MLTVHLRDQYIKVFTRMFMLKQIASIIVILLKSFVDMCEIVIIVPTKDSRATLICRLFT